jgi:tRNA-2-methylthio-N6-dimethylallyladenosine synthase
MNMSDSERTQPIIESLGYQWTDNEEEADLLGIIACSVRQKAIDKVYSRIHKWNKAKNHRNLITFLSGCILPDDKKKFLKLFDIVFPMSELKELPQMIRQYGINTPAGLLQPQSIEEVGKKAKELTLNDHIDEFWNVDPQYVSSFEAFVPIQNGCDKFCTYCAVPFTRGREISRPSGDILKEVQTLIDKDYKSITILGQNVNSYGLDKKGKEISFAELLEKIGEMGLKSGKEFWVYFTSPHPRDMTDDVLEAVAKYPHLGKQIHIPVQAGDDDVLHRMNRKYDIAHYRTIIDSIWRLLPEATVFTDIIVGFNKETDEEFQRTRDVLKEFRFNMAYIAQYSQRPGARAAEWEDDVPVQVKKQRYHQLTDDLTEIVKAENQKLIGQKKRVLVRGTDRLGRNLTGLTEGKINVIIESNDESLIGSIIDVKINDILNYSVKGRICLKEKPSNQ